MNSEGTAHIPTQKSATECETINALVLVRSCRLLQTRKIINPFAVMVRMERDQPRIQNQVFIFGHRMVYQLITEEVIKANILVMFFFSHLIHVQLRTA